MWKSIALFGLVLSVSLPLLLRTAEREQYCKRASILLQDHMYIPIGNANSCGELVLELWRSIATTVLHTVFLAVDSPVLVRILVRGGACPCCPNHLGRTALWKACALKREQSLSSLLPSAAQCASAGDGAGITPLHVLARRGRAVHVRMASELIENGADVNSVHFIGATPLLTASMHGNVEIMNLFIEAARATGTLDEILNAPVKSGATPLVAALQRGNADCAISLVSAGADVHAALNATYYAGTKQLDRTKPSWISRALLSKHVANTTATPSKRRIAAHNTFACVPVSALEFACMHGLRSVVRALLHAGADASGKGMADGCTPLYVAAAYGQHLIVQDLKEHGGRDEPIRPPGATHYHARTAAGVAQEFHLFEVIRALQ